VGMKKVILKIRQTKQEHTVRYGMFLFMQLVANVALRARDL